ncbi:IniB N-terminal domain-containing protein [Pseudonocardia xishanensis]|uniref:Uncharacterized protein n=1 Tax=Pseudonocardia xishanensis TaxID=630995 RepID=A0ABP8RMP3_9PSEU
MDTPTSLIQLLLSLLSDPKAAAEFQADPQSFLATCGITAVTPEQVHDAAVLVADQHAPKPHHGGGEHHHQTPPPPAPDHGHDHESAVKYLQTIVTNNWIDDRDTNVDNSVHQVIHAGGDVNQTIDNDTVVASGDGAVAAGDDISDSTVTTGNGNAVGDGSLAGDDNTVAYGSGDANSATLDHVTVDHGGALAVGGAASGVDSTTDSYNEDHASTTTTTTTEDSFNDTTSTDTSVSTDDHSTDTADSYNHTDLGSHNDVAVG